jgi:uncharacterized membrane protein YadS
MTSATDNSYSSSGQRVRAALARPHLRSVLDALPGIALAAAIAVAAFLARSIPGIATFSPMILAILIGTAFHNVVGTPLAMRPGIAFSLRRLLRAAIVLLGFQLTLTQIASVGTTGLLIVAITLIATFVFTVGAGRVLGVDGKLTELIAAGTSICGASAIVAANTVTEAYDEDVAYAVACVTIFGSVGMFAYPLLFRMLILIPWPADCGAAPPSMRSRKWLPQPSRTGNALAKSGPRSSWLASCCSRRSCSLSA